MTLFVLQGPELTPRSETLSLKVKQRLPVILAQGRYLRHFDIISPYEFSEIKMAEQKLQQDQVKVTRSWMKSVGLEKRLESSARS